MPLQLATALPDIATPPNNAEAQFYAPHRVPFLRMRVEAGLKVLPHNRHVRARCYARKPGSELLWAQVLNSTVPLSPRQRVTMRADYGERKRAGWSDDEKFKGGRDETADDSFSKM